MGSVYPTEEEEQLTEETHQVTDVGVFHAAVNHKCQNLRCLE